MGWRGPRGSERYADSTFSRLDLGEKYLEWFARDQTPDCSRLSRYPESHGRKSTKPGIDIKESECRSANSEKISKFQPLDSAAWVWIPATGRRPTASKASRSCGQQLSTVSPTSTRPRHMDRGRTKNSLAMGSPRYATREPSRRNLGG